MQDNTSHGPQPSQSKDPSQVWWSDAAGGGRQQYQPPAIESPPLEEPWRWRYSWMFGIMYGPIPVGIIIGLPLLLALMK